jgi:FtsH-binding integral membrane protein
MKFKNVLSTSLKNCIGILVVVMFNLYIAFDWSVIFTVLILPIHAYGAAFHGPTGEEVFPSFGIFLDFFFGL